ncbi:MAG: VWA domain-containing protein [Sulfitobacter sp.]|nr:VWA domain-containing protein [Sulfitobacter sp.]
MRIFIQFLCSILFATAAFAQNFTLEAPDEVGMRQSFEVVWEAPEGTAGRLDIRAAGDDSGRVSYAYLRTNPQPIEAPELPGAYVIDLIVDGESSAQRPLQVIMVEASLTLDAVTVDAGAPVTMAWDGPSNRGDIVMFAEPGGDPIRGSSYSYVGNSKDGTISLRAPQDAGLYDVVYRSGTTILARAQVEVGSIAATLDIPATGPAGAPVPVGFDGPENSGDLIMFAERGGDRIRGASYGYVGNARDGKVTLRAFEEPGSYDVAYISGDRIIGRAPIEVTGVAMQISAPGTVETGQRFSVEWTGQGNVGDIIHLYPRGSEERAGYRYIAPTETEVPFIAPDETGLFDLVYITRGGAELARTSLEVVPAPVLPGRLEVVASARPSFGEGDAVQVILDASGSMLQRQGGERRIEIAKRTLSDLVRNTIPPGTAFALRVFGNREADACRTDLEIPLAPLDPAQAEGIVTGLQAINLARTPIAQSLALSQSDLQGVTGERLLILITDGEETCEGDPAVAIADLRASGQEVKVNIIGYAIDDAALAQTFESWAAAGGGAYFPAEDAAGLSAALARAISRDFEVFGPHGTLVAEGEAGGEPLSLPPGTYRVRLGDREASAEIASERLTQVSP